MLEAALQVDASIGGSHSPSLRQTKVVLSQTCDASKSISGLSRNESFIYTPLKVAIDALLGRWPPSLKAILLGKAQNN